MRTEKLTRNKNGEFCRTRRNPEAKFGLQHSALDQVILQIRDAASILDSKTLTWRYLFQLIEYGIMISFSISIQNVFSYPVILLVFAFQRFWDDDIKHSSRLLKKRKMKANYLEISTSKTSVVLDFFMEVIGNHNTQSVAAIAFEDSCFT
jgi:hypothetical protein